MLGILNATEPTWTTRNRDYANELWQVRRRADLAWASFARTSKRRSDDAAGQGIEMPMTARGLQPARAKAGIDEVAGT